LLFIRDRIPGAELRGHFGIEDIDEVLHTERLGWFGYMERMGVHNIIG